MSSMEAMGDGLTLSGQVTGDRDSGLSVNGMELLRDMDHSDDELELRNDGSKEGALLPEHSDKEA